MPEEKESSKFKFLTKTHWRKALCKDYFAEKEGVKKFQILVFDQNRWLTPLEKCQLCNFLIKLMF